MTYQAYGGTCPKCGMPYTTGGCGCPLFKKTKETPVGIPDWTCPVCGRGLSPYMTMCPCKEPPKKVTCGVDGGAA